MHRTNNGEIKQLQMIINLIKDKEHTCTIERPLHVEKNMMK